MPEETLPHDTPPEAAPAAEAESAAASASDESAEAANGEEKAKLHQDVEMRDVGPCKKHIKVTVHREDIDARMSEKFKELVVDSSVAGFRPGKAPRRLVERRFAKDVGDQVKTEVLLASLEQLAEDHDIAPLSSPNIDPGNIQLPKDGPLVYEFDVEVRPQFDLPNYKGLKLKRPMHTFTEEEVQNEERRLLAPYGQVVPKPEFNAQLGDILIADATIRDGQRVIGTITEAQFRIDKQLAFKDGLAPKFAEQVRGANPGDQRVVDVELSSYVADPALQGKKVQATFEIKDVKTLRLPELTHEFLHTFGVHSEEQFHELMQVVLQRRLEHQQRQSFRAQVLEQIAVGENWQLPEDLLLRQARKAMSRRIMEMRSDGIPEPEIQQRVRLMQQDVLSSTALALKEHFVLQKIAEDEKIDINEDDLNDEIERMAAQSNESPRRVRARLEKEDLLEALGAEMIERKAMDLILESAEYEDVPLTPEDQPAPTATVEAQAVPGEMQDPAAAAEAAAEAAEAEAQKAAGE
jgi:trigger factor